MNIKLPIDDGDGNLLPSLDESSDLAKIIYLLEYARARDFRIGPMVQIGDTVVQVSDMRQVKEHEQAQTRAESTIWQENGHDDASD